MRPSTDESRCTSIAACARSLAGGTTLLLAPGGIPPERFRGVADAAACHSRFALPNDALAHRPTGNAGAAFDALAMARAESLGCRWLPGVARNLSALPRPDQPHPLLPIAFTLWIKTPLPEEGHLRANPGVPPPALAALQELGMHLDDPLVFASLAATLSHRYANQELSLEGVTLPESPWASPDAADASASRTNQAPQEHDDGEPQAAANSPSNDSAPGVSPPPLPEALTRNYRIYTRAYDRIVTPQELANPQELQAWRDQLDQAMEPYRRLVNRLAHRLQRKLLARQQRHWQHDLEDGQLNPSRLARLVAAPTRSHIFRLEDDTPFPQTAVTLLLDNSGSMKGRPILMATLTTEILVQCLERCGIKTEVLAYTTVSKDGGPPFRDWQAAGSPENPGRLNALRHVIYKAMDTPWRRARQQFGLMLNPALLNENIDGEALAWAHQRLSQRPEARKLLIVISDGAPHDKTTNTHNTKGFLEQHLHQTISWITSQNQVTLKAIGIGYPVGRYYIDAIQLRNIDNFGNTLFDQIDLWLN